MENWVVGWESAFTGGRQLSLFRQAPLTVPRESLVRLPEVREMVETARRYLRGEASIIDLYAASGACADSARRFGLHPEIVELASRWQRLADAAWNEWGMNKNPPSPDDVRDQLLKELGEDGAHGARRVG